MFEIKDFQPAKSGFAGQGGKLGSFPRFFLMVLIRKGF